MIRIARTFDAKPGKFSELLEIAEDIRGYLSSQGVEMELYREPFGYSGRLHWHVDYEDAEAANATITDVFSNKRGQELVARMETLIEGHGDVSFLFEEE